MVEQQTADLGTIVDALAKQGLPPDGDALSKVAKAVAKIFSVDADEVAILSLNTKSKNLKFVIPEKLAAVGTIPLSSATALAARTARERRPELVNNFSTSRHATVFEGVPLGRDPAELIQKIMSAPILEGNQVRGVVQISRKGRSTSDAGLDFTQKDLQALTSISPALVGFLKICTGA
ncbi:MAG: GAF domain-containing protein [Acidobacteriia bacterium]|nr:GAF domain-containing protein [Terriglobia bacterium]